MATATNILNIEYFPFDPTGTAATNVIRKEQQVISAANYRDYHYIIPRYAPFFEATLVVRHKQLNGQTRVLRKGIDYYVANKFRDASLACSREIYGSISFLDTSLAGVIELDYNTIGGMWNVTEEKIAEILAEELRNPRIIAWEQIVDLPERFPIIDHEWDLADMTGMKDVKVAVDEVAAAILQAAGGSTTQHINDFNNPHRTNKEQVGLGLLFNYPIATTQQAIDGVANTAYMTPQRTASAIAAQAGSILLAHSTNTQNPHNTTKTQVGLSNVENYPMATLEEAMAGTLAQAYMSPALVRAAVNSMQGNFADHIRDPNNPHGTTKTQVGLSQVQNYPIATLQEAQAAVRNDRYMTPLMTKALVTEYVTVELDSHAQRTDNPHQTDKDQVGLGNVMNYEMATDADMAAGTAIDKYVNPYGVRTAVEALVPVLIASHTDDHDNPHEVTAAQVGAYTRLEIDSRFANYVRIGDQVGDSLKWGGESHTSYRDWLLTNMQDFNALKFNGMNYEQAKEDILRSVDGAFLTSDFYQGSPANIQTIPFGVLTRIRMDQSDPDSIVTSIDRHFVIVGSNLHEDGVYKDSYAVMVQMSVRQHQSDPPKMIAYPMYGCTLPQDMRLGYIWEAATESMIGCVIVGGPSDSFNVVDISGQSPNNDVPPDRMMGIPPAVTQILVGEAPDIKALSDRIAVLENTGGGGVSALETRVLAIEQILSSIQVV